MIGLLRFNQNEANATVYNGVLRLQNDVLLWLKKPANTGCIFWSNEESFENPGIYHQIDKTSIKGTKSFREFKNIAKISK